MREINSSIADEKSKRPLPRARRKNAWRTTERLTALFVASAGSFSDEQIGLFATFSSA